MTHDQRRLLVSRTPKNCAIAARMSPAAEAHRALEAELCKASFERLYRMLDALLAAAAGADRNPPAN